MKLHSHIALSLAASVPVYLVSRSLPAAAALLVSGVLLDLDHCFDYVREYGLKPDIAKFFHTFHNTLYRRVVIPLHAWEWLAVVAALSIVTHGNGIVVGILIGMGLHLVADQFTNGISAPGYFFLFRLARGFVTRRIFPGKGLEA